LISGAKISFKISASDINALQKRLTEIKETEETLNSGMFISLISSLDSVKALDGKEQQDLLRATGYLMDNISFLGELKKTKGAISNPYADFFLDGVTGHYHIDGCTTTFGKTPKTHKSEWFAFSCDATNGTVCNLTTPQTYTLYWCDE